MAKKPTVSVILPVFNREKYIERAVNSILKQTLSDWELIIIDDGSTDNTGKICDGYSCQDSRIRVIHTKNFGVSHARNTGLDIARGEWIAFLDSDDEYSANALETMSAHSAGADVVVSQALRLPSNEVVGGIFPEPIIIERQSDDLKVMLFNYVFDTVWCKLIRREAFDSRFDETMMKGEDSEYMVRAAAAAGWISYVPSVTYLHYEDCDMSLHSTFLTSQLYCAGKFYNTTVSCFSDEDVHLWAGKRFAWSSVIFANSVVSSNQMNRICKMYFLSDAVEKTIIPIAETIRFPEMPQKSQKIWTALLSGSAEKVITAVEDNLKDASVS